MQNDRSASLYIPSFCSRLADFKYLGKDFHIEELFQQGLSPQWLLNYAASPMPEGAWPWHGECKEFSW